MYIHVCIKSVISVRIVSLCVCVHVIAHAFVVSCVSWGHSMSNQRKIKPTPLDFDDTRNIVWVYGENNPHKILAPYVTWLPSYNDSNFVSFC